MRARGGGRGRTRRWRRPNEGLTALDQFLRWLDLAGIAVSAGSACSSGKIARSHVLDAMGVDPHMGDGAIRVSFGWSSSRADVEALGRALTIIVARRRTGRAA